MSILGGSIVVLLLSKNALHICGSAGPDLVRETLNVTNAGFNSMGLIYRTEPKSEQSQADYHAEIEKVMEATGAVEWF